MRGQTMAIRRKRSLVHGTVQIAMLRRDADQSLSDRMSSINLFPTFVKICSPTEPDTIMDHSPDWAA